MLNIVVDLTSLLPKGENGGAKIMTLQLIKRLGAIAPDHQFILLANRHNAAEIAALNTTNIKTFSISPFDISFANGWNLMVYALFWPMIKCAKAFFPFAISARVERLSQIIRQWALAKYIARQTKADLFFYPFTAVNYKNKRVPAVSVVYDLQFQHHPYFFTRKDLFQRRRNFATAYKSAAKIICISDFVRGTVLETGKVPPEKLTAIPIQLGNRLLSTSKACLTATLRHYDLEENNYLLYPANFWQHKNHQMLFTAFQYYRSQFPDSQLKLVCTGEDNAHKHFLANAVREMGLAEWIKLPGFLEEQTFANLLLGCKAVIFPSLYEGFGMPIIEAMTHAKPVLCSHLTSLPEIAGAAALFFDPRKPTDMAEIIAKLENSPRSIAKLIEKGKEHALKFSNDTEMASEYLAVFHEVVKIAPVLKQDHL